MYPAVLIPKEPSQKGKITRFGAVDGTRLRCRPGMDGN